MMFRGIIDVYCGTHTKHLQTLSGQNAQFLYIEVGHTYTNHWALNSLADLSPTWIC
jgi:hypothetical protein